MRVAIVKGMDGVVEQLGFWRTEDQLKKLQERTDRIASQYWIVRCKLIVSQAQYRIRREENASAKDR